MRTYHISDDITSVYIDGDQCSDVVSVQLGQLGSCQRSQGVQTFEVDLFKLLQTFQRFIFSLTTENCGDLRTPHHLRYGEGNLRKNITKQERLQQILDRLTITGPDKTKIKDKHQFLNIE